MRIQQHHLNSARLSGVFRAPFVVAHFLIEGSRGCIHTSHLHTGCRIGVCYARPILALAAYMKSVRLQVLIDPAVALSVLQRSVQVSHRPGVGYEHLKSIVSPTLIGLYAISSSVEEGVGLVIVNPCSSKVCN